MDEIKQKKLFDFFYNFIVDIFSNGIINFIKKMFIIGICAIMGLIMVISITWFLFTSSDDIIESKHLLKPDVKIEGKDTIYVYTLK
jgi:Na+/H+ antiporter NhaD/arsenite permease-like protein